MVKVGKLVQIGLRIIPQTKSIHRSRMHKIHVDTNGGTFRSDGGITLTYSYLALVQV
jgi:hypothetical protein